MPKVVPYKRVDEKFDWQMVGDNGEQMCESHQGYNEKNDAVEGFERVRQAIMNGVNIVGEEEEAVSESELDQVWASQETEVPDQQLDEST